MSSSIFCSFLSGFFFCMFCALIFFFLIVSTHLFYVSCLSDMTFPVEFISNFPANQAPSLQFVCQKILNSYREPFSSSVAPTNILNSTPVLLNSALPVINNRIWIKLLSVRSRLLGSLPESV